MTKPRFSKAAVFLALATMTACATGQIDSLGGTGGDSPTTTITPDAGTVLGSPTPPENLNPNPPTPGDDAAVGADDASLPGQGSDASVEIDSAAPIVVDAAPPPQGQDAGTACGSTVPPATHANCNGHCSTHSCAANGCYNSYWCDTSTDTCVPKPSSCP